MYLDSLPRRIPAGFRLRLLEGFSLKEWTLSLGLVYRQGPVGNLAGKGNGGDRERRPRPLVIQKKQKDFENFIRCSALLCSVYLT